jgi:hypothetical protein
MLHRPPGSLSVPLKTSRRTTPDLDQRATDSEAYVAGGAAESDSATIETHP